MHKRVTVIGLGYIGLPLVAVLAKVGFGVIGLDINKKKIRRLKQTYRTEINEPGLNELLQKHRSQITFTSSYEEAIPNSKAIFITVGTPIDDQGKPDNSYLKQTFERMGKLIRQGQIIILKSTVSVGTTEGLAKPMLEELSGMKAGEDFYLVFCPERTIEGKAVEELSSLPNIIGGINQKSMEEAEKIISRIGGKIIRVSNPRTAEMSKIIDNCYRSINILFANEAGFLCEKAKISMSEVRKAVNDSYERNNLFGAGLGADGPCLYKDLHHFLYSAKKFASHSELIETAIKTSDYSDERIALITKRFVEKNRIKKPRISLLGVAFKGMPETDDTRGSPATKIVKALKKNLSAADYSFFDPMVEKFEGLNCSESIENAIASANVIMFLNNHKKLRELRAKQLLERTARPLLVIDAWENVENPADLETNEKVLFFGIGKPCNKCGELL